MMNDEYIISRCTVKTETFARLRLPLNIRWAVSSYTHQGYKKKINRNINIVFIIIVWIGARVHPRLACGAGGLNGHRSSDINKSMPPPISKHKF